MKVKPQVKGLGIKAEIKPSDKMQKLLRQGVHMKAPNPKGRKVKRY